MKWNFIADAQDYRPTYMKSLEAEGALVKIAPWVKSLERTACEQLVGPRCQWSATKTRRASSQQLGRGEVLHPSRKSLVL